MCASGYKIYWASLSKLYVATPALAASGVGVEGTPTITENFVR